MRDYAVIAARLGPHQDRNTAMQKVVDALWTGLADQGVSWLGFYLKDPAADQLLLGPRRDKPACSPIGLHGVCGQAFTQRRCLLVRDVNALGEAYVACDPRDRSEVVVPLFESDGSCWGVLDLDSFDVNGFDQIDLVGLIEVLGAAALVTADADGVCIR
ncbi:MAG: GAF domain-containing protein [Phycisphaerae bacterium]